MNNGGLNINANKLMYFPDRVAGDRRPITADVFIDNFCNNRCPYCTYRRWELESSQKSYMHFEDFKKYVSRLRDLGVLGFIITGGGEPTCNPDFDLITEWLESECLHYGINTNFNIIKYFKPDYLKVSLDGWDEDSYEANRGVRHYEQVRENIVEYDSWRKKNAQSTTLGVQKVVATSDEIIKFYEANKDLPFDYMVLRPFESTLGEFYKDAKNFEDAKNAIETIEKLREKDSRVVLNFKWSMIQEDCGRCLAHWAQMALNERGEVIYCCHKPYQTIGHIMDEDIMEKHRTAHTNLDTCDIPCRLTAPNMFLKMLKDGTKDPYFI